MPKFERNLAIIIGINSYQNGISPLQNAVNDAKKLNEILRKKHGYQMWVCLDEIATLENLNNLLEKTLPQQVTPDDRLLFYFAGHGIALNGDDGAEGFLIPQDARLGDTSSYLPMTRLQAALSKLPCRHFLGILDCCFAGAFRWSSSRDLSTVPEVIHQERYDRFISDPAWQVITSADYDQKAADNFSLDSQRGSRGKHSPFAAALIEALTGKADIYPSAKEGKPAGDGVITATELYLYLRDRIEPATEKYHQRQTPSIWPLKKHNKGEYIFLTPGHQLNLPPAAPLDKSQNPYRGLESFNEEHSDLFFGRQALTEQLYQFSCQQPLTIVLGASGTGKSSLVKAGLITYLQQLETGETQWHMLSPMRPGEFPLKALNKILTQHNSSGSSIINLTTEEKMKVLLGKIEYLLAPDSKTKLSKLLLVVDQTEELFTICRDEQERQNFLHLLAQLLKKYPPQLRIVLTLRSDFEPQFRNLALEPYWQKARFIVPAMTRDELRAAIEKPAEARVMYFEPHSLVDQLIDEVAQMPGALPLLSFTLSELYLKYLSKVRAGIRDKRAITQEDYEEIGGVAQSLTQRADSEYKELVKQEQAYAQTVRHVMLRMIAVGGGELARRRVLLSELEYPEPENERVKQVIGRFSTARLLVEGQDAEGKPYVEPAHDALVRGWQKLLAWKQDGEESLILQRRLTPSAWEWKSLKSQEKLSGFAAKAEPVIDWFDRRLWVAENLFNKINVQLARLWRRTQNSQVGLREKPEQFLWNGNPYLNVLNETLNSTDNWFNQVEAEFVQQSVLQKRRNTSWRQRIAIAIILGLSGLSIAALIGQRNAQIGQAIAFRESAEANLRSNQGFDGMILGLRAAKSFKKPILQLFKPNSQLHEQVRGTLLTAIYQLKEHNRLEGHTGGVRSVSFSPSDSQLLATSGEDGTIRLWDLQGQELEKPFRGHQDEVRSVSFSPNGQQLATAGKDGTVRLWNLQGQELETIKEYQGEVKSVSFSPDGQLLATAGKDGTVRLWNLQGQELEKIEGHQGEVKSVSYSPDGQRLATAGKDGTVRLWNLQGKNLAELKGNKNSVSKVNFSPDGQFLAIARKNGNFSLWNLANQKLETLPGNQGKLWYVMFSPDGQRLATAGEDGTVRLWNLQGQDLEKLAGHRGPVRSIGFSRDGQLLATAGDDGTVRLWNSPGEELVAGEEYRDDPIRSVSYSPDGERVATAGEDGTVRLWNFQGEELAVGKGHQGEVRSVSYSPDGQLLATAGEDGTVRLWNFQGEQIKKPLQGHKGAVYSVVFSPDGQLLATAGEDETVRLWDTEGKELKKLVGHTGKVHSVAFSLDGQQLATAGEDETARLWDTEGKELKKLVGHLGEVYSVAFSPNGQQLATAGEDGTVRLWNKEGEQIEKPFQGHKEAVRSVAFSPDGKMIVSSGEDDTVKFWDLQGQSLTTLNGDQGEIYSVAFSPDGQQLATAGNNSTAKLWEIKSFDESIKSLCAWAWDYLQYNPNVSDSDRYLCDRPATSFRILTSLDFTPITLRIKRLE